MSRFSKSRQAETPNLIFLQSEDQTGFTSAKLMSFRDRSPSAIIRELIQNSLDATKHDEKTLVCFELDKMSNTCIPGIQSYRNAFDKAVDHRKRSNDGKLPDQEKMIVDDIQASLKRGEQDVLIVRDNGIGLNEKTMNALLSDGVSVKQGSASGAFGNGHFSVFPSSSLRYVLYGAIYQNGNQRKRIASGHAILASHEVKDEEDLFPTSMSANALFLLAKKDKQTPQNLYPEGCKIPSFIAGILDEIEKDFGTGTAVIVPAFNHFGEGHSKLHEAIAEAAVCSFFAAIDSKKLEIRFIDKLTNRSEVHVHHSNLQQTLNDYADKRQNRDFLSGQKAAAAYECLKKGDCHRVPLLDGFVQIFLKKEVERTRINLCRNGMWITNNDKASGGLPGFYNSFGERESFEALILIEAKEAKQFHDLIRKAEGPLHNRLDIKTLPKEDERKLRMAFRMIKEWLMKRVSKVNAESFNPEGILEFDDDAGKGKGNQTDCRYRGILKPISSSTRSGNNEDKETKVPNNVNKSGGGEKTGQNPRRNLVLLCASIFVLLQFQKVRML